MPCSYGSRGAWPIRPLCLILLLLACGPASSPPPPDREAARTALSTKTVLILHAHEANAPVFVDTDRGITTVLQRAGIPFVDQFFLYLDLRRNPDPAYRRLLVEEMRLRFARHTPDVIVTLFPEALEFLLTELQDILPDAPVLALYLPEDYALPRSDRVIIGHSAVPDIAGTFETALRLFPKTKHVDVLCGSHAIDRRVDRQARRDLNRWEGPLTLHYLSGQSLDQILSHLSSPAPDTLVLLLTFIQDKDGRILTMPDLSHRLCRASRAPVFTVTATSMGSCTIGGLVLDFERIGEAAGELILDILRGQANPAHINRLLITPSVPMFDARVLRHWHLSASSLPHGSVLLHGEPTLWDLRYYAIGGLAFLLLQSFLLVMLFQQKRRKELSQASLRQRNEELDQFFTVSEDLLCVLDAGGRYQRSNPAWERTLGYSSADLLDTAFTHLVHPDDIRRTQEALARLATGHQVVSFQNRYRRKDGTYRWLDWTAASVNKTIYAAARDITERLTSQAEAMHRRSELCHVSRVAAMGELTSSLAHEINQPLAAILTNAQAAQRFLARGAPDLNEVRQILDDIVRDDMRAGEVVRNVRALLKKEAPSRHPLDLNQVVRDVVPLVRGEALVQDLSLVLELSPRLPTVQGDRNQLAQVLLNLLLNAAAAMRDSHRERRKITLRTTAPDSGTAKVSVTDSGPGFGQNDLTHLFEPFYTTKHDGLGMGLSISNTIIKAHGGTLSASNNPEGGATVCFSLPASQGGLS